jgi:hypothetical protein
MLKKILIAVTLSPLMGQAMAQTKGDWNGSYSFPSSASNRQVQNMQQADLIAKKDAGYYDGLGKTTVYSTQISTYTVGSLDSSTNTVNLDGANNTVSLTSASSNTGDLNGAVRLTDINRSTVTDNSSGAKP